MRYDFAGGLKTFRMPNVSDSSPIRALSAGTRNASFFRTYQRKKIRPWVEGTFTGPGYGTRRWGDDSYLWEYGEGSNSLRYQLNRQSPIDAAAIGFKPEI
jgi:hypothetical protein